MSEFDARFSGVLGEDYDLFGKSVSYHDELQQTVGKLIQQYVEEKQGEKSLFLEAGVGTGLTTVRVLTLNPSVHVTAVDNEPKTLNQAREALKDFGDHVSFIESDILAFLKAEPDAKYDGFFSAYLIHNLPPDIRAMLIPEIARVLKSDGLYINADKLALDDEAAHAKTLAAQIEAFTVYDQMGRPEVKEEWTKHYLDDDKIRLTESAHQSLLSQAGFLNVERVFREGMDAIFVARKG